MMKINLGAIADDIIKRLEGSPEFKQFCDDQSNAFDKRMQELIDEKFVDPIIAKNFRFGESAEEDENHFEFVTDITYSLLKQTVVYSLLNTLNKYYVTQYTELQ